MLNHPAVRVAWLIPEPHVGSGGHRTIINLSEYLCAAGFDSHLYLEGYQHSNLAMQRLEQFYGRPLQSQVRAGFKVEEAYDIAIATIWYTAQRVAESVQATRKVYLVQDYEPYFFPMGDDFLNAEQSYRFNLVPITLGRWLRRHLHEHLEVNAYHTILGVDLKRYYITHQPREKAVCMIYQPEKPRRAALLGLRALALLKSIRPEIKVYLYGSSQRGHHIPFAVENLGVLSIEACRDLYNRCSVGLSLSMTNPSRVPFEMMACGLPVVELYRDNTRDDFKAPAVLLAEPTPASLASALLSVLDDERGFSLRSESALHYAKECDVAYEYTGFKQALESILKVDTAKNQNDVPFERLYHATPHQATVQFTDRQFSDNQYLDDVRPYRYYAHYQNLKNKVVNKLHKYGL